MDLNGFLEYFKSFLKSFKKVVDLYLIRWYHLIVLDKGIVKHKTFLRS